MNPVSKFTPRNRREKCPIGSDNELDKVDNVHVYCRLKPLENDEESTCIKLISPKVLALSTPVESKSTRRETHCQFKHIFTAFASQKEVFEYVAYPLLENLIEGKNGLLFTYGVTGSGKTHTLTGEQNDPGVMPKCIYTLFNSIEAYQAPKYAIKSDRMNAFEIQSESDVLLDKYNEAKFQTKTPRGQRAREKSFINDGIKVANIASSNTRYSVFINYIEIYNNAVYDLLDENTNSRTSQAKILREDANRNMYVNGVVEVEVKSASEAFEMFNMGQKRKRMGATRLNAESSRSHSIFTIRLVQIKQGSVNELGQPLIPSSNQLGVSQLSLVDLAGSERTNRTQHTGQKLKEASQINNSLMALRNCLEILRENQLSGAQQRLVPYRDSRLTLLFKNYFEGAGRISMIVCVNPSVDDFDENLHVVKFAETTQEVRVLIEPPKTPVKKVIKKRVATPAIITKTKLSSQSSFMLGPKINLLDLDLENPDSVLSMVDKTLALVKLRQEKSKQFFDDLFEKEAHFRKRLANIQQNSLSQQAELMSTKNLLKKEKQRTANLNSKMNSVETASTELQLKNREYETQIRGLQKMMNEKDMKLNRGIIERERDKQKLVLTREKLTHELDAKLRRQRDHLQAQMKGKDQKIRQVKELLDQEIVVPEKENQPEHVYDVQETPKHAPRRNAMATPSSSRRRRSKSVGSELWLEHNAVKPVPLNTVLQPSMKKRKSVTKLSKASDVTNPKQSKYCLIAQEQDTDGEVETKLYKGDILATTGGGAQVIFNDVELLRQESPTGGN